jgi:CRISPR-associated endoribonuclease Cas6
MRFRITLAITGRQHLLPIDNQYFIGAWIYKIIGGTDKELARFLHSHGYTSGNKSFKFFCYSPLNTGTYKLLKEKSLLEIASPEMDLQVSFHLPDVAEKFIIGLFRYQEMYLGDKFNGMELKVKTVESLQIPEFTKTMDYTAASPVCFSMKQEGEKYARYLSPLDNGYEELVKNHLIEKSKVAGIALNDEINIHFREPVHSKMIRIRPYTPEQTMVRGFKFSFRLVAPVELHQLIYNAGFGKKNATGFGWLDINKETF